MTFIRFLLRKLYDWSGTSRARKLILGLFIVQAVFLVFATNIGTPPDEYNHVEFVQFYANNSLAPVFSDQEPTWHLGDKTREVDYLYHYLMSWIARALPFSEQVDVFAIRLLSVLTTFGTLLILTRLWRQLKIHEGAINVALLIVTNLPMVLMISSAVNNDALVWFGVAAGSLLLVRLYQRPRLIDAALLSLIIVYGGLVKRTMLPVVLAMLILGGTAAIRHWATIKRQVRWRDWRIIVCTVLVVVGVGLAAERIGGNIYTYGTITPECTQVQGAEACKVFWGSARDEWVNNDEAKETDEWLQGGATKDDVLMPFPAFVVSWLVVNFDNIVDIQSQGWRHAAMPPIWLGTVTGLLLIVGMVVGLVYDVKASRHSNSARMRLLITALLSVIVVAQFAVNFSSYQHDRVFGLALNGRYLLPAILPLAGIACFYWSRILKPTWSSIFAVFVIGSIMIGSGIIMMLRNPQLFTG